MAGFVNGTPDALSFPVSSCRSASCSQVWAISLENAPTDQAGSPASTPVGGNPQHVFYTRLCRAWCGVAISCVSDTPSSRPIAPRGSKLRLQSNRQWSWPHPPMSVINPTTDARGRIALWQHPKNIQNLPCGIPGSCCRFSTAKEKTRGKHCPVPNHSCLHRISPKGLPCGETIQGGMGDLESRRPSRGGGLFTFGHALMRLAITARLDRFQLGSVTKTRHSLHS
jgi:hypothetical protein